MNCGGSRWGFCFKGEGLVLGCVFIFGFCVGGVFLEGGGVGGVGCCLLIVDGRIVKILRKASAIV